MMQLYLLRHGIAEDAKAGGSDSDRALTAEGRRKLRDVLKRGTEAKVKPDLILSSPLKRAWQTAAIARQELGVKEQVSESRALLPGSSPEEVWSEITVHGNAANSLLLVGHNPLFAELAAYLLGTPNAQIEFKKGALMRIDFQSLGSKPKGVLRWYLTASLASKTQAG